MIKTWEDKEVERKQKFNLLCDGAARYWERQKINTCDLYCDEQILYFNNLKKKN